MFNTQRDGIFFFNRGVFDIICFDLLGEPLVQSNVSLGVRGHYGVGEFCQEVGHLNLPPCLRKQLLPKLVYSALVVLGVTEFLPMDLEYLDARDGWILESRFYQQGVSEVGPLLIELLLSHMLSSACFACLPAYCGDHARKQVRRQEGYL